MYRYRYPVLYQSRKQELCIISAKGVAVLPAVHRTITRGVACRLRSVNEDAEFEQLNAVTRFPVPLTLVTRDY
jgi:hypothetical protein